MLSRESAIGFLGEKVANKNIIKHMLATEVLMGGVYDFLRERGETDLGGTKEEWMMAGLLHDGDYSEEVPASRQGVQVTEWLRGRGMEVPGNVAGAMAAHNAGNTGVKPVTKMDWAMFCGDSLTGLIVAAALVLPSRKLSDLTVESVLRRFREKSFARGTRREDIELCGENLGVPLEEFVKIGLTVMQKISGSLGL